MGGITSSMEYKYSYDVLLCWWLNTSNWGHPITTINGEIAVTWLISQFVQQVRQNEIVRINSMDETDWNGN